MLSPSTLRHSTIFRVADPGAGRNWTTRKDLEGANGRPEYAWGRASEGARNLIIFPGKCDEAPERLELGVNLHVEVESLT